MARIKVNGTLQPIRQSTSYDFDPVRGLVATVSYRGAGPDSLVGLLNYCIANRVACNLRRGVVSSLDMTYSGGQGGLADVPQTNYELLGNEIQKHIYESGIALSGLASYPSLIADVKYGWAAIESGDSAAADDFRDTLEAGELTYYDQLIGFLMRGQTHFATGQYVVRKAVSISNFYNGSAGGEGNVERLLSTASLLSACAGMPAIMVARISSIPGGTAHTDYAWSWRQLPSRMITNATNRVEVSTEWWYEEWSTLLYGAVI